MKKEDYLKESTDLKETYNQNQKTLDIRFARTNNPYRKGDIVEHKNLGIKLKIENIKLNFDYNSKLPCCMYFGPKLKKDDTPYKNGERVSIHQLNIKK